MGGPVLTKEPLDVPPPLLYHLLAELSGAVHSLRVQDDRDDGSGLYRREILDEPLEVGVVLSNGQQVVIITADTEIVAVEGVVHTALSEFMVVYLGEVEDVVTIRCVLRGNIVTAFDGTLSKLLLL